MRKLLIVLGACLLVIGTVALAAGFLRVGEKPAKVTWANPEFRSALMTFAYKVYGNPKVQDGRHYLCKITFKNTGDHPVTDFAISYKLQDYIPWTDPETMSSIPTGFSFAKLFYPRLPAEVTKLRTATTCSLQVKATWKEEGQPKEMLFRHDVLLRAVNELTYSDLPSDEVESWQDAFDTSDFAVAMVTPNDPVVTAYAAEITKAAGGTTAGIAGGPQEVQRLCKVAYEYMVKTGLRYTGDSGVPANYDDVKTLAQVVRLPRDVILNNNGLCIELAILWSSVLQHLGVKTALIFRPGHAYIIAYSPEQKMSIDQGLPIETTAITPRAVGRERAVPFEEAVKMAAETVQGDLKDGRIIILPVSEYQQIGFTAPELPEVDITKITETLERRMPQTRTASNRGSGSFSMNAAGDRAGDADAQQPAPPQQTIREGGGDSNTWTHPQGFVSIDFPPGYVALKPRTNPGNVLMLVAGNSATGAECDVMHVINTTSAKTAWQYVINSCNKVGIRIKVEETKAGENGMYFYSGSTLNNGGTYRWVGVSKPAGNGVVFVTLGTPAAAWQSQYNNVIAFFNNVHFQ